MKIKIDPDIATRLAYLVELHKQHGAPDPMGSLEELENYVLGCVADGSRRPESWECGMLHSMGLVPDLPTNECWLHESAMQKKLIQADEWMDQNSPQETDLAELALKFSRKIVSPS